MSATGLTKSIRYNFIQIFYFSAYCIMFSFSSVFFKAHGYTDLQIGQIMAVSCFVIIIAQPLFGLLADHFLSAKKVILLNLVFSVCMTGFVYLFKLDFVKLLFSYALISFSEKSLTSLIDSWISNESRYDASINYGVSRGLGSFGQALCSVIGGVVIDRLGFAALFSIHIAFLLFAAIIVATMPVSSHYSVPAKKIEVQPSEKLYKNREYIRIVFAATVLFLGVSVEVTYFPILFQSNGGTNSQLGFALFIMSMSELLMMSNYKKISSYISHGNLMLVALAGYTLKLFLQVFLDSVPLLIMLQLMQGVTYGLFLPSLIGLVSKNCNEHNTSTAITVCFALFNGIGFVAGNFIAGMISEQFGLRNAFAAASFLCLCSIICFCFRPSKCNIKKTSHPSY